MYRLSFFVSVLVLTANGSLVEVNEKEFATWPELYLLDDWSRCLADPAGIYCTVDAALTSDDGNPLLERLQAYSAQTLKHYNRTEIHRGVCVTRACVQHITATLDKSKEELVRAALQPCINESVFKEYRIQVTVTQVRSCRVSGQHRPVDRTDLIFAIVAVSILMLNLVATVYDIFLNKCCAKRAEGSRLLLCFSLVQNWRIITFDRTRDRDDPRLANLSGIEGIRVLTLQGVIFSHILFVYLYSYIDNPEAIEEIYDNVTTQQLMNGPLWIQIFFSIGGFLLSYTFLIDMEKRKFSWWLYLRAVVVRWLRLTPMAMFALGFTMTWFAHMGSGPQWDLLVTQETEDCRERWWYHLLYVHNHIPTGKFCMGHTWYIACDLQLVFYGALVMLLVVRYPRTARYIFVGSMLFVVTVPFLVVYFKHIWPIVTAQAPESIRHLFLGSDTVSQLYIPAYMNGAGYLCGLFTGYTHYHLEQRGIHLSQYKWFNALFHLSLMMCHGIILVGCLFLSDSYVYEPWSAALYAALDRTVMAVFFNILLLGMVSRCKSSLCSILEWRGFQLPGRLTYCAYLVHFLVLRLVTASTTSLGHYTGVTAFAQLISTTVLTYVISLPLALMVEYPLIGLEKALTSKPRRHRPEKMDRNANVDTEIVTSPA